MARTYHTRGSCYLRHRHEDWSRYERNPRPAPSLDEGMADHAHEVEQRGYEWLMLDELLLLACQTDEPTLARVVVIVNKRTSAVRVLPVYEESRYVA